MLRRIHIENFKSLQNVTLDLQRINLLIGPNNSGKSNFLKAIEFFHQRAYYEIDERNFSPAFQHKLIPIKMIFNFDTKKTAELSLSADKTEKKLLITDDRIDAFLDLNNKDVWTSSTLKELQTTIHYLRTYKPDPIKFSNVSDLKTEAAINDDCSNLVPFLFNLGQNNRKSFRQIEDGLKECVGDLVGIGTPAVEVEGVSKLRLKFFDKNDNDFWADEVSEGVLYFLALLCIVHQPNPPKLLLLEEPERGIHPRRIQEVMDFIFHLAETKDIQVIMTTHHERVVDYFADIPESVFVFDKNEEGATQVKNLKNIIELSDAEHEKDGLPKIDFTASLGEHWAAGFMGGVPK